LDLLRSVLEERIVAARLQGMAEPGQVLLSGATERLVRGYFELAPLGRVPLRGVEGPVEAFRVERESKVESRFAVARTRGLTRLVGRDAEVAHIVRLANTVRESGSPRTAVVIGEAGVGKSRVVDRVGEVLRERSASWLVAQCAAYHRFTPFHPLKRPAEALLGIAPHDEAGRRRERVEASLRERAMPEDFASALGRFVLAPGEDYAPTEALPHRQKERAVQALGELLMSEARRSPPLVLVVEDLHWVDPSTLEFIDHLARAASEAPLLILGTARPDFQVPAAAQQEWEEIPLERVDPYVVREMIRELNGGRDPGSEITRTIVEKTDGVPL
jgi:predicted ATPase